jgi:hypothetical protein
MAQMYPKELSSVQKENTCSAELRVYEKARDELGHNYHVFFHFDWHDPQLEKPTGEIDLIIAHPEKGFLCLEVKGGICSYDPKSGLWFSKDGKNKFHSPEDPFRQALLASKSILNMLPEKSTMKIPHSHAVIFPDCIFPKEILGEYLKASIQSWQVLDQVS